MKNKFFGYIPYNEEIFEDLWGNSTFVIDANILLNLYRYTKETQEEVINCLEKISERLWIPYNTADEYFRNRLTVISDQQGLHRKIKDELDFSKSKNFIQGVRHLTLNQNKILGELENCEKKINNILEEDKKNGNNFLDKDTVLEKLVSLFNNKIGEENDEKKLESFKKEIDKRYDKDIPPGYKDKSKGDDRKYGDCINWLNIMDYAKKEECNIIYITDDKKEDWICVKNGKTIGPRPELLNEFYKKTDRKIIYIYNTKGFLENFKKHIKDYDEISDTTIEEVNYVYNINDISDNCDITDIYSDDMVSVLTDLKESICKNTKYNMKEFNDDIEYSNKNIEYFNKEFEDIEKDLTRISNKLNICKDNIENGLDNKQHTIIILESLIKKCTYLYNRLEKLLNLFEVYSLNEHKIKSYNYLHFISKLKNKIKKSLYLLKIEG